MQPFFLPQSSPLAAAQLAFSLRVYIHRQNSQLRRRVSLPLEGGGFVRSPRPNEDGGSLHAKGCTPIRMQPVFLPQSSPLAMPAPSRGSLLVVSLVANHADRQNEVTRGQPKPPSRGRWLREAFPNEDGGSLYAKAAPRIGMQPISFSNTLHSEFRISNSEFPYMTSVSIRKVSPGP